MTPPAPIAPLPAVSPSRDPQPDGTARMVWNCPSATNPRRSYRVDLLANNGHGFCSCVDHATRRQPFLDAGGSGFDQRGRCKHVAKVRAFFLQNLLTELSRQESSAPATHQPTTRT